MNLTITDLAVLKDIIDVASSRGAFKPSEMKAVGEVYEKLAQFLDSVIRQAEQDAQATNKGEQND
jgi:hypothetical protein